VNLFLFFIKSILPNDLDIKDILLIIHVISLLIIILKIIKRKAK